MRRIYLLLFVLPLIAFSGCQKTTYLPNRTIVTDLSFGDWTSTNGGRTYSAGIDMPEIDSYLNERGGVLVYLSFGDQTYEQIPQVYSGVSYSYTTQPGQIVIDIQSSDGTSVITHPGDMTVKIILVESDY